MAHQKMREVPTLSSYKYLTVKTNSVVYRSHPGRIVLKAVTQVKSMATESAIKMEEANHKPFIP